MLLALVSVGLPVAAHATPDPVTIDAGTGSVDVDGHFEALLDPTGKLSIADVSTGAQAYNFEPIAGAVNFGFTGSAVWVRFRVTRTHEAAPVWILDLTPAFLDSIQLFVPNPDGAGFRDRTIGRAYPLAVRPIPHNDFLVPLTPREGTQTYYVRLQTNSSMLFHAALRTQATMISRNMVVNLGFGVFYGIILSIVIVNLLYLVMLRERVFLACALFCGSTGLTYFAIDGFTAVLWFPNLPIVNQLLVSCGVLGNVATGGLVFYDALDLRRSMPWAARAVEGMMALSLIGVIAAAAGHYREIAGFGQVLTVLFTAFSLVISARTGMRGTATGWLLFVATLTILFGLTLSVLRTVGVLPSIWLTDYSFPISFAVYVIVVDLAVALRVKVAEAARAAVQRELVTTSRAAEGRANRLVDQRTRALMQAKARAERALHDERQAMTQQIRLADMLAHEYRTPLSTIRGNLDILRMIDAPKDNNGEKSALGRTIASALQRMEAAVERLTDVIELGIRDRGGALGARPVSRDLRDTLGEAIDAALDAHGDRTVEVSLPDTPVIAPVDDRLLRIALANVFDNALKYSDLGSRVDAWLRVERGEAVIIVRDEGVGIPADEIAHVFARHYRSSSVGSRQGTGIGLHLSERVVDAHGGQITIESELGAGTTVTILLPLAETETDMGAAQPEEPSEA